MKNKTLYKLMAIGAIVAVIFAACTEETADVRLEPTLSTANTLNVTSDSATIVGFVVAQGDGFTERGVCYNTSATPTIENNKKAYTKDTPNATFHVTLAGLDYATKYYARAYATGKAGTVYGEEVSFTTAPVVPFLTTAVITEVTGNSAKGGGEVTGAGGADVTARGIVFGTSENPTTANSSTVNGEGLGAFESILSNLKGNTTYYVRTYAKNAAGTGYGAQVSFKTLVDLPKVTTTAVTTITKTSAVTGGTVSDNGGAEITAYGLVWSLNSEPTTTDNVINATMPMDSFVIDLANLDKYTKYYVRAFASNSAGTAYGENIEFTTLADIRTWNLPGGYVEASYPGAGLANWSPDKSPQVISTISSPDNLEGYVYFGETNNEWKFATQLNWSGPNYGDDGSGILNPNGGNIQSPKGFYKINADAIAMTYTAIPQVWGVIGSATAKEWGDETPLVYSPKEMRWQGVLHLTAAEFKFRANHTWDYNYGSDANDGTLQAGGKNIPVDVEGDYAIELNLSKPNEYTYSVNRWGLIGDATPGKWGTDTDMTWDTDKKVYTITLDLVVGAFKFRANDKWDVNYGGDLNALSQGGDNIAIDADGNYTITLDIWGKKATVTKN